VLFNSFEFLIFLFIVYSLYVVLTRPWQNRMLLVASYVFYGWWDARFLMLIVVSTAIDFTAGLGICGERLTRRERMKISGVILFATAAFVLVDWPRVAAEGWSHPLALLGPHWQGGWWAVGACIAFAALAPFVYGLYFRIRNEQTRRRFFLVTSMVANLGLLGFFKYFNFFVDSAQQVLTAMGVNVEMLHLDVVLPVGISFYTFQTMSYTIDLYRKEMEPTRDFFGFALYVAFFPQLVAGPIERASRLLPQILGDRRIEPEQFRDGVFLICWGLFKKVLIADRVAVIVNEVFGAHESYTGMEHLLAIYAFAWQIYCDFSAYSDIARGLAKIMGIELMVNFRLPYFATNPSEFWRRWHISLSTWLRDYLYIPLGGNRGGEFKMYRNLCITMLLGGLWHGAAWTFVLWGAYQGAILVIHRVIFGGSTRTKEREQQADALKRGVLMVLFFQVTCFGWLIFRADSVPQIWDMTRSIFTHFDVTDRGLRMLGQLALLALPLYAIQIVQHRSNDLLVLTRWKLWVQATVYILLAFASLSYWLLFSDQWGGQQDFIYFQF
jgi:D-alanyl-lipoteichoic acid acyltransferase DltB (MBOAT superfamily)